MVQSFKEVNLRRKKSRQRHLLNATARISSV
jgi:hypothetical protein